MLVGYKKDGERIMELSLANRPGSQQTINRTKRLYDSRITIGDNSAI